MKKIVVPGDFITDQRKKLGSNVYLKENKVYSSILGILSESNDYVSVIPLNGPYIPKEKDAIVGIVKSENMSGYLIDINLANDCFFPKSLLKKQLQVEDVLFARIKEVSDSVDLENINLLPKGRVIQVPSVKIPRIIGKNDSMLKVLKENTESNIVIGRNGLIWYYSKDPLILEKAINLIVKNSQKSKLTNYRDNYLKKEIKRK
jgi:exosome complex component RRP4